MKEGFERYRFGLYDDVFVSITRYGMTFSVSSVRLLGYPAFAEVYVDRKGKRFGVAPGKKDDPDAKSFVKDPDAKNAGFVRWNEKGLIRDLMSLGNLDLGEKGIRIPGKYVAEDQMVVYDLSLAEPIKGRGK